MGATGQIFRLLCSRKCDAGWLNPCKQRRKPSEIPLRIGTLARTLVKENIKKREQHVCCPVLYSIPCYLISAIRIDLDNAAIGAVELHRHLDTRAVLDGLYIS